MLDLKPVELDATDQARLADLNDKTTGLQRFMVMITETGERRASELQKQGRELFNDLAQKYGLDLEHIAYVPSPDSKRLVPISVNLQGAKPNAGN